MSCPGMKVCCQLKVQSSLWTATEVSKCHQKGSCFAGNPDVTSVVGLMHVAHCCANEQGWEVPDGPKGAALLTSPAPF